MCYRKFAAMNSITCHLYPPIIIAICKIPIESAPIPRPDFTYGFAVERADGILIGVPPNQRATRLPDAQAAIPADHRPIQDPSSLDLSPQLRERCGVHHIRAESWVHKIFEEALGICLTCRANRIYGLASCYFQGLAPL